jgi:hypothetical protein
MPQVLMDELGKLLAIFFLFTYPSAIFILHFIICTVITLGLLRNRCAVQVEAVDASPICLDHRRFVLLVKSAKLRPNALQNYPDYGRW